MNSAPPATSVWLEALDWPELGQDDVHVWRASLDLDAAATRSFQQTLSNDERAQASRFHFTKHQRQFVTRRGLVRKILARYLGSSPAGLGFQRGPQGKPSLIAMPGEDTLHFNLSHSQDLALLAVSRGCAIGVDVEHRSAKVSHAEIASRFFSPREVATLRSLPKHLHREAFFNCWTRKEAFIKADGKGLTLPLDHFDVSLVPGESAALLATAWEPAEVDRWSMRDLHPGIEYAGAICMAGCGWQLKCWQWPVGPSSLPVLAKPSGRIINVWGNYERSVQCHD